MCLVTSWWRWFKRASRCYMMYRASYMSWQHTTSNSHLLQAMLCIQLQVKLLRYVSQVICLFCHWPKLKKKEKKWSMWVSNSRPSRYQHDALPTELMDQSETKGLTRVLYFLCGIAVHIPVSSISWTKYWPYKVAWILCWGFIQKHKCGAYI